MNEQSFHPDGWQVGLRIWVERTGRAILGKGSVELLSSIGRCHSISAAARELGWETIKARIFERFDDELTAIKAELAENDDRKPWTRSEMVQLLGDLESLEKEAAKKRQASAGGDRGNQHTKGKGKKSVDSGTGSGIATDEVGGSGTGS